MEQLPNEQTTQLSQPPQPRVRRVILVSVQPKSWIGKLIAGIFGAGVMLVAFFLSILAFATIASLVVVATIYFLWVTYRARRMLRRHTNGDEVRDSDIQ